MCVRGEPTDQSEPKYSSNLCLRDELKAFFPTLTHHHVFPHFLFTSLLCLAAGWPLSYDYEAVPRSLLPGLSQSHVLIWQRAFYSFSSPTLSLLFFVVFTFSLVMLPFFLNLQRKHPGVTQQQQCTMGTLLRLFWVCCSAGPCHIMLQCVPTRRKVWLHVAGCGCMLPCVTVAGCGVCDGVHTYPGT